MITGVQVYNALGDLAQTLGMSKLSPTTKYVIRDITGQGPVKAEYASSVIGTSDGEKIQSSRIPRRNLVIDLAYNPSYASDETVEDLRLALYGIFSPGETITLRVLNNRMETVKITGQVESLEPVIFTDKPTIQLSLICPTPFFSSLSQKVLTGIAGRGIAIPTPGTAYSGFRVDVTANANLDAIKIDNGYDDYLFWEGGLSNGQTVVFSTVQGNRYVTKNGSTSLRYLTSGSLREMNIGPLVTSIGVSTSPAGDHPVKITYTPKYAGV